MAKTVAVLGRGPFDAAIVEGFSSNKSAEEVSDSIGGTLTPAQCLARLTKLIQSKDVLDASDKVALLLEDVYYLRAKLKKQMEESDYITKDAATMWLKTIEVAVARVESVNVGMSDALMRFNQVRANEFVASLTYIIDHLLTMLQEQNPDFTRAEIDEKILLVIPESIPEVK